MFVSSIDNIKSQSYLHNSPPSAGKHEANLVNPFETTSLHINNVYIDLNDRQKKRPNCSPVSTIFNSSITHQDWQQWKLPNVQTASMVKQSQLRIKKRCIDNQSSKVYSRESISKNLLSFHSVRTLLLNPKQLIKRAYQSRTPSMHVLLTTDEFSTYVVFPL